MVAKHNTPEEPLPSLSPAIVQRLEQSLRAFLKAPNSSADDLRSALEEAARDARDRGLRAEDLLLILKSIEQRIGASIPDEFAGAHVGVRTRLIRAMIEAYYMR